MVDRKSTKRSTTVDQMVNKKMGKKSNFAEPNREIDDTLMGVALKEVEIKKKERVGSCQVRTSIETAAFLEQIKIMHGCRSIEEVHEKVLLPLYREKNLGDNGMGIFLRELAEVVSKHALVLGPLNCQLMSSLPAILLGKTVERKYELLSNLPRFILEKNNVLEDRKKNDR